jgi:hypothetical protein
MAPSTQKVEEYSGVGYVTLADLLRIALDHPAAQLDEIVVLIGVSPVDQDTEDGSVEWEPCLDVCIPEVPKEKTKRWEVIVQLGDDKGTRRAFTIDSTKLVPGEPIVIEL